MAPITHRKVTRPREAAVRDPRHIPHIPSHASMAVGFIETLLMVVRGCGGSQAHATSRPGRRRRDPPRMPPSRRSWPSSSRRWQVRPMRVVRCERARSLTTLLCSPGPSCSLPGDGLWQHLAHQHLAHHSGVVARCHPWCGTSVQRRPVAQPRSRPLPAHTSPAPHTMRTSAPHAPSQPSWSSLSLGQACCGRERR